MTQVYILPAGKPIPVYENGVLSFPPFLSSVASGLISNNNNKPAVFEVANADRALNKRKWQSYQTHWPSQKPFTVLRAFVDGSYFVERGTVRIGAGVYFGDGDEHNRCVPVPRPKIEGGAVDSLRAELYASLLCAHIAFHDKCLSPSHSKLVIYQDSIVANHLLRACKHSSCAELVKQCPSNWAKRGALSTAQLDDHDDDKDKLIRKSGGKFEIDYVWGERSDGKTILQYADVLDEWWFLTRNRSVEVRWVQAHQKEPDRKLAGLHEQWKGNHLADTFAKLGSRVDKRDRAAVEPFADYPLFRRDPSINLPPKQDPKTNYLPLFPQLSDRPPKRHISTS